MPQAVSADSRVAPLAGALPPQCQRDVDSLRAFVRRAISDGMPPAAVPVADVREVLLTGATGFVGRFVLRDLLRMDGGLVVHCLVRAADREHGLQRLRAALEEAEIWDEAFAARIRVVPGDIGEPRLGLSQAAFDELARRIDAVHHFAADVSLSASYLAIRKTNAFSMRNVLELCLHTRRKHLFYASTMGVFPQYFCDFANEFAESSIGHQGQPDLAPMKRLFPLGVVGYPWSKVVAEQSLLFAQQAGLPVAIFRLPQTSRSSEGFTQPNDTTVRVYAAINDVQMIPDGFSFQGHSHSVDTLSRICTAVAANPERRFTLYHCCNPNPVQHELELADFGLYLREVPYDAFKRACQARGEAAPLHGFWALLDHFSPYWFSASKVRAPLPVCDRALREDCPFPIEWPGILTMFRRTNDWVRRHRQQWPFPLAEPRLDYDRLLMRAERYAERMGVSFAQTYPEWIRDGLAQLVRALQAPEAGLLENKRAVAVSDLSRGLRNNAALAGERQRHPEIDREEVKRPLFIIGINRTGTTYLHRLLSRDPRFWTLRGYELLEPVLTHGTYAETAWTPADVRRLRLQDVVVAAGFSESFAGVHDVDVDEPEEDFGILRQTFASWSNTNIYQVPEYGRWLEATGSLRAYAYHRRTMQHFTWQRHLRQPEQQAQWLLKAPVHLMELEALVAAYPDACFIQTHREPRQFMGSWCSLMEQVRSRISEPPTRHALGQEQLTFMSDMLERAVRFREAHPELQQHWCDVNYLDLVDDPWAIVRRIYEHFDWPLEPAALAAMEAWQARQAEKRRGERRHRYNLQDYDLTADAVDAAFSRYRDFISSR